MSLLPALSCTCLEGMKLMVKGGAGGKASDLPGRLATARNHPRHRPSPRRLGRIAQGRRRKLKDHQPPISSYVAMGDNSETR